MTLQTNALSGATNTLRQRWYELFLLFAVKCQCKARETFIFVFPTFEISPADTRISLPKNETFFRPDALFFH